MSNIFWNRPQFNKKKKKEAKLDRRNIIQHITQLTKGSFTASMIQHNIMADFYINTKHIIVLIF